MPRRASHPFPTTLFVIVLGYSMYAMVTESGPYRWLVELQGRWFGAHYPKATLSLMVLGGGIAAAVIGSLVLRAVGVDEAAPRREMSARAQTWLTLLAGIVLAGGAAVTGWLGAQAAGAEPVEMPGVAHSELAISVEIDRTVSDYIPLTPAGWQPGQPVALLLHRAHSDAAPRGPWKGALIENGLPAIALPGFEKHGVTLGAPYYVLDASPMAGGRMYFIATLLLGGLALSCLLAAPLVGRARRARDKAEAARAAAAGQGGGARRDAASWVAQ